MTNETNIEIPSFTLNGCPNCNSSIAIGNPQPNRIILDLIHAPNCEIWTAAQEPVMSDAEPEVQPYG